MEIALKRRALVLTFMVDGVDEYKFDRRPTGYIVHVSLNGVYLDRADFNCDSNELSRDEIDKFEDFCTNWIMERSKVRATA